MAIDTSFLKLAKDQVKATKAAGLSFVRANPRLSIGTAAAMAIAPKLFENDNRNYFQTASITTPLLGAASYAVPGIAAAFRTPGRKFATSINEAFAQQRDAGQGRISYEEMVSAQAGYEEGTLSSNAYSKMMRRWHSGRQRQPGDLNRQANSLMQEFRSTLKNKTNFKSHYLSNAIHAEKLRALDAQGQLGYFDSMDPQNIAFRSASTGVLKDNPLAWKSLAPDLSPLRMRGAIREMKGNRKFMSGMQSRIQQMKNIIDPSGSQIVSNQAINAFSGFHTVSWANASRDMKTAFRASHPDVFRELENGLKNRKLNPRALEITSDADGVYRAVNYRGARVDLWDQSGRMLRGEMYRQTGIGRMAYTQDAVMPSDVYGAKALAMGYDPKIVQKELSRINLYGGVDGTDATSAWRTPSEETVSSQGARMLRPKQAVPSELFGFGPEGRGYSELTSFDNKKRMDQEAFLHLQTSIDQRHGFNRVGSEGGTANGVRELGETRGLAFWGATSVEKQDAAWRSFTKNVGLTNIPSHKPAFSRTDYLQRLDPTYTPPEIGAHVAHVSAQQKTIFGDLPVKFSDITAEHEQNIIAKMMEDASVTKEKANKAWKTMQHFLSNEGNYNAMRHLGYMGEGTYLTEKNLYGMKVQQVSQYDVHELRAADWAEHLGVSLEDRYGAGKGEQVLLGYRNGSHRTGRGQKNYIENTHNMGNGMIRADVREEFGIDTGTKFEGSGVKGEGYAVENSDIMDRIHTGLNTYSEALGTGNFIPDEARFLQVLHYSANKSNPTEAVASMAGDLLRRLNSHDQIHEAAPYLARLQKTGADFDPVTGTMTFDTSVLAGKSSQDLQTLHEEGTGIIQEMFDHVGSRVRSNEIQINDPFFNAFRKSNQKWEDFVLRNADPRNMRVTNTTHLNLPEHTKFTYDMSQQMAWRHQHAAAAEIQERLKVEGDVSLTESLHEYMKGDTSKITKTAEFSEAFNEGKSVKLSSAASRAGTTFSEVYGENYLQKLPDGSTIPVLGYDAYGGQINKFGAGEYSGSDMEQARNALLRGYKRGDDAGKLATLRNDYENTLKMLRHGKENYLRAENSDPLGLTGFLQARSSTLRYEDGSVNPFQMGMDPEMVDRLGDKALRQRIMSGEAYGAFSRHPVSHLSMMQIVPDENLRGTNMFGMDEGARALHMADFDGDMGQLYMMKGDQAVEEARSAVHKSTSVQSQDLRFQRELEGAGDDARLVSAEESGLKNIFDRAGKVSYDLDKALLSRSTSGTVGMFSNTLTNMLVGLDNNSNVLNATEKSSLGRMFFTGVRQGTISAAKAKNGGRFTRATAMGINQDLRNSLGETGSFDEFFGAMKHLGTMTGPDFVQKISEHEDLLRKYHSGVNWSKSQQAARAMTDSADMTLKREVLGLPEDFMPYVQTGSHMTDEVAATQGAINDGIKATASKASRGIEATETLFQDFRRVASTMKAGRLGTIAGLGLAAAAALGIASTSIKAPDASFGRTSAARYRPEEVAQSSPDVGTGTMAPANPPRNVYPVQKSVQTAVTAPLGETRDLDVQMRAPDQSRAHETAKLISRMSTDGDSHVTVNYRGRMKPNSLRTREKVRDMLNQ